MHGDAYTTRACDTFVSEGHCLRSLRLGCILELIKLLFILQMTPVVACLCCCMGLYSGTVSGRSVNTSVWCASYSHFTCVIRIYVLILNSCACYKKLSFRNFSHFVIVFLPVFFTVEIGFHFVRKCNMLIYTMAIVNLKCLVKEVRIIVYQSEQNTVSHDMISFL